MSGTLSNDSGQFKDPHEAEISIKDHFLEELNKIDPKKINSMTAEQILRMLDLGDEVAEAAKEYIGKNIIAELPRLSEPATLLLGKVFENHGEFFYKALFGSKVKIEPNEINDQIIRSVLDRKFGPRRDGLAFIRSVFDMFKGLPADRDEEPLSKEKKAALPLKGNENSILKFAALISDTKIHYPGQEFTIENERHERTRLTFGILRELRHSPSDVGKMVSALETMATYDSHLGLLEEFLLKADTDNPYEATRIMRYESRHARDLPKSILDAVVNEYDEESKLPISCKGASGVYLVESGELHLAYAPSNPKSIFVAKRQGALGPFRHWRPDVYSEQQAIERARKRDKNIKEDTGDLKSGEITHSRLEELISAEEYKQNKIASLEDVTLEELEQNSNYKKIADRSPILARDLLLYKQLRSAISELKSDAHRLIQGQADLAFIDQTQRIISDPGGRLLGNIKRRLEAEGEGGALVPDWVKTSYYMLSNPDVPLSSAQEKEFLKGLLSWEALTSNMSNTLAFDGVKSDMDLYEQLKSQSASLAADHPIHAVNFNFASLRQDYQDVLESTNEVPYAQVLNTVEALGVKDWRSKMNHYLWKKFEPELTAALSRVREMFQVRVESEKGEESWQWRGHSTGSNIPEAELRKHIYGARISKVGERKEKQPVLNRIDLRHVMNLLTLEEFDRSEDHAVRYQAIPVARFQEMLIGVILAGSKAEYLDLKMVEDGISLPEGIERKDIKDSLNKWNVHLLVGGYSKITRMLPARMLFENGQPLTGNPRDELQEIIRRADSRLGVDGNSGDPALEDLRQRWSEIRYDLTDPARVGLYCEPIKTSKDSSGNKLEISGKESRNLKVLHRELQDLHPVDKNLADKIRFATKACEDQLFTRSEVNYKAIEIANKQLSRLEKNSELPAHLWYRNSAYLDQREFDAVNKVWEQRDTLVLVDEKLIDKIKLIRKMLDNDMLAISEKAELDKLEVMRRFVNQDLESKAERSYVSPHTAEQVNKLASFADEFSKLKLDSPKNIKLAKEAGRLRQYKLYDVANVRGALVLKESKVTDEMLGKELHEASGIKYFDPAKVRTLMFAIEGVRNESSGLTVPGNYVAGPQLKDEVPPGWFQAAKDNLDYFFSSINQVSLEVALTEENARIKREMIDIISALIPKEFEAIKAGNLIGNSESFEWRMNENSKQLEPHLLFSKDHEGKSIYDCPVSYLRWSADPDIYTSGAMIYYEERQPIFDRALEIVTAPKEQQPALKHKFNQYLASITKN